MAPQLAGELFTFGSLDKLDVPDAPPSDRAIDTAEMQHLMNTVNTPSLLAEVDACTKERSQSVGGTVPDGAVQKSHSYSH